MRRIPFRKLFYLFFTLIFSIVVWKLKPTKVNAACPCDSSYSLACCSSPNTGPINPVAPSNPYGSTPAGGTCAGPPGSCGNTWTACLAGHCEGGSCPSCTDHSDCINSGGQWISTCCDLASHPTCDGCWSEPPDWFNPAAGYCSNLCGGTCSYWDSNSQQWPTASCAPGQSIWGNWTQCENGTQSQVNLCGVTNTRACNTPPQGILSYNINANPPLHIYLGQSIIFTLNGSDYEPDLSSTELLYSDSTSQHWYRVNANNSSTDCSASGGCPADITCTGSACHPTRSWTPTAVGNYYVTANFFDSNSAQCSGNPFVTSWPSSGFDVCSNPQSNDYVQVIVDPPPPIPTCTISASPTSVNYASAATISWSSTNATSCTISSPNWTGTSGSHSTGALTATKTYTCNCSGAGGNSTPVSTTVTVRPLSTVTISGNYQEDTGVSTPACLGAFTPNSSYRPTITVPTETNPVITNCTYPAGNSYNCTITFNTGSYTYSNVTNETFQLSNFAYNGYSTGWRVDASGNTSCSGTNTNPTVTGVNVTPGGTLSYSRNIYFKTSGSWFKLGNTGFNNRTSGRNNIIPQTVNLFDGSGDDTANPYLIVNQGEAVAPLLNLGSNPGTKYSADNWSADYSPAIKMTPTGFLSYIKSRKSYNDLTPPNGPGLSANLSEITTDGLYYYKPSGTLTVTGNPAANFVLIVDGNVAIDTASFNLTGANDTPVKSIAILSTGTLSFDPSTAKAGGIFVGQNVDLGSSSTPLKIKGNLISMTAVDPTVRARTDTNSEPSVFVVASPPMYLDLLPYLSVAKYDYQELQ